MFFIVLWHFHTFSLPANLMRAARFNSVQSMHSFIQYTFTEHLLLPRHSDGGREIERVYLIEGGRCQGSGHSAVATGGSESRGIPSAPSRSGKVSKFRRFDSGQWPFSSSF